MRQTPTSYLLVFGVTALLLAGASVAVLYERIAVDVPVSDTAAAAVFQASWEGYRREFIVAGRVIRPSDNNDTVSEGQAYGMLRALWMRDKDTFDACYRWTERHLSRLATHGDHLLAWHYGRNAEGVMDVLDWNVASDADLDYALALLTAARLWPEGAPPDLPDYRRKALHIAEDILRLLVHDLPGGETILLPWPTTDSRNGDRLTINPSYFSPGHYRVLARETGDRAWLELAGSTYAQLDRIFERLGDMPGTGLVPDWCEVDAEGRFHPSAEKGIGSSWDAFRIWWRVRLDLEISGEPEARRILDTHLLPRIRQHLSSEDPRIVIEYDYTGRVRNRYESAASLGLYAWSVYGLAPDLAQTLRNRLHAHYDPQTATYESPENYYVNSWAWFGTALSANHFPFPFLRESGGGDLAAPAAAP